MSYIKQQEEECLACEGHGEIVDGHLNDPYAARYTCPVCLGSGAVDPDDNMTMDRYEAIRREMNRAATEDARMGGA